MVISSKFSSWDKFKNRDINAWALVLFLVDPVVAEDLPSVIEQQEDIQLENRIPAHTTHDRDRPVYFLVMIRMNYFSSSQMRSHI